MTFFSTCWAQRWREREKEGESGRRRRRNINKILLMWCYTVHTHDPGTRAEVLAQRRGEARSSVERRGRGGAALSKRGQVEDKMWISDALAALVQESRKKKEPLCPRSFPTPMKTEWNHGSAYSDLCHLGSRRHSTWALQLLLWRRTFLLLLLLASEDFFFFPHSQIPVRSSRKRGAFQFIKGKLFLKSTLNHNTPFLFHCALVFTVFH